MAKETKILQVKRGTTTDWASEVAPLRAGELGYDTTTKEMKCGDGATAFASLPALGTGGGGGTGDVASFSGSVQVTVGASGNYATLNEALEVLSKNHASFPPTSGIGGPMAMVGLLPGYVITEPVICNGVDLSWIYIVSVMQTQVGLGSLVTVNADSIRLATTFTDLTDETVRAVFIAANNGVCPVICFGFTMTGTPGQNDKVGGLAAVDGGKIFMRGSFIADAEACQKIDNCEGVAVFAGSGGYVNVNGWNISGCRGNVSVNAYDCGRISLGWGAVSGATGTSVVASYGGVVSMDVADVSGAGGSSGVRAYAGGKIIMIETNARKGASDSADDIVVQDGGIIVANLATGGTSQTPNTITADGIIFK